MELENTTLQLNITNINKKLYRIDKISNSNNKIYESVLVVLTDMEKEQAKHLLNKKKGNAHIRYIIEEQKVSNMIAVNTYAQSKDKVMSNIFDLNARTLYIK